MKKPLCLINTLLLASSSLLSPMLHADPMADAIAECRQQQNALKRLVCYDEITVVATAQASASPATASNTAATARAGKPAAASKPAAPADNFGLEHKKTAEKQADQLYLTVQNISYSPRKELIVEFDNGQIWRQNDNSYYDISVGEQHYIKRGMLNSFTLGNDNNNRTIKVRRVE
ncbi:hypothetical protein SAMN06297280_3624 [Arsukibacterium tuosuense]|uniref:Uncharacterized protein n=1 Tax=Arsukibacterium tuosuense TaxID=1323745 RepID=A0A285JHI8_9GAMM|nr:hypothetical protein [Arsukibacterium tuosuense]SNY59543.1 hypothetical protein SAMN06297280_3624 [Arsukibacterium tuosuense]